MVRLSPSQTGGGWFHRVVVARGLQQIAHDDFGLSDNDLRGRPFNQFKNYVWSQLGQIALYEILVREGFEAARVTVTRLVAK